MTVPAAAADPPPHALILAAGVGRRMGGASHKALLEFGGRSLIARHLDLLAACGVRDVTVVVGHQADSIQAAVGGRARFVHNPDYRQGSVVSLWAGRDMLRSGRPVLLMDADVLYDARLLRRLVESDGEQQQWRREATLLLDREFEAGEEPVKLCIDADGEIVDFRKRPDHPGEWRGESVGFFRFQPGIASDLAARAEEYVGSGRRSAEYEEPIRDLILAAPQRFGYEDITGLPWVEIDFEQDLAKAQRLLPLLLADVAAPETAAAAAD